MIWTLYTRYRRRLKLVKNELGNFSSEEWKIIASMVKRPNRIVGIFEEYSHPWLIGIFFYRNILTGQYMYPTPSGIEKRDKLRYRDVFEQQTRGFTGKEVKFAMKLQAIWKGHKARSQYKIIASANKVSLFAEVKYFREPDIDHHLWNYALHCFVVSHEIERARGLFVEALRRMDENGPDEAFILYSYAIFGFVTHDLDYIDVLALMFRARKAEEVREENFRISRGELEPQAISEGAFIHGNIFTIADIGFFGHQATKQYNSFAAHNFAACRFLVYNDFIGSFNSFLEGFKCNAKDMKMKSNFDVMMRHFHGDDEGVHANIVVERMRIHAKREEYLNFFKVQRQEVFRRKINAVLKLQEWWLRIKSRNMHKVEDT